jgi:hypothetical protein
LRFKDESALGDAGEKPGPAQGIQGSLNEARRADGFHLCLGTGYSLFDRRRFTPPGIQEFLFPVVGDVVGIVMWKAHRLRTRLAEELSIE